MVGTGQGAGKPGDIICLCIGGRLFVTRRATLYRLPDSRLYLIATQGSSCEPATDTYSNYSFQDSSYLKPPTSTSQFSPHPSTPNSLMRLHSNPLSENATVGGASILPSNVASMLTGNMNLKSASSLCRNRGSIAPGTIPQSQLTPLPSADLNSSFNLSVSGTPGFGGQFPFTPPVLQPTQPPPPIVYFYDRDPEIFRFVLDYYRTGELHLPSSICGPFVRKELIFWGIDEALIGPCCMPAYMRYDEEKRTKNTLFRDCFEDIDSMQNLVKFSRGWKKWRYQMWLFMDHPSSSLPAKIWASCLLVLMIASVMCYCLSTHEVFRMPSTVGLARANHSIATTGAGQSNYTDLIHGTLPTRPPGSSIIWNPLAPRTRNRSARLNGSIPGEASATDLGASTSLNGLEDPDESQLITICYDTLYTPNPKIRKDCSTEPSRGLVIFDNALNCLFTAEFMLKVLLAPDKPKFLSSIVSVLDIVILSSYWVYITVFYYYYYYPKTWIANDKELHSQLSGNLWLMNILSMTQAMRILRIFKISKISRGLRVLILTVKKSIPELVLLGFLLMNGMFMFSCMIYIAEYRVSDTFPDIPQSFWWSIITLTAVGYGDMHPKGGAGYFIGSVTAISGCVVTGLAIPIIGNNFNTYYKYMKNQLMEDKYLKNLRKDMESTGHTGSKSGIGAAAEKSGLPLPGRKPRPMNRRGVRGRAGHKGLRQKLDQFLHLTADPFRRIVHRSTPSNNRSGKLGLSKNFGTGSTQALTENQHLPCNNIPRKSVLETRLRKDDELGSLRNNSTGTGNNIVHRQSLCRITQVDNPETEKRLSIIHPLATDKLLSSLPPSRLSIINTPQIWVDGEEMEDELCQAGRRLTLNECSSVELVPSGLDSSGANAHSTALPDRGHPFSPHHSILSPQLNPVPSYTELDVLGPDVGDMTPQSEADMPEQLSEAQLVARRFSILMANSQRQSSILMDPESNSRPDLSAHQPRSSPSTHRPVVEKRMNYV